MQPTPQKERLEDLPDNGHEMWEHAEVHGNITPVVVNPGGHYFVQKTGREAECTHCSWGFSLDPGDKIVDGHLFDKHGVKVI